MSTSVTPPVTSPVRPWYREPWPWLLMLPPLLSIVGGLTMVHLAIRNPVALVVADYARIEALTSERHARDAQAAALDLRAELSFAPEPDGQVRVRLMPASSGSVWPDALHLRLQHVAYDSADRTLLLRRQDAAYAGVVSLAAGVYEVELLPPDGAWRLAGTLRRLPDALVLAAPVRPEL